MSSILIPLQSVKDVSIARSEAANVADAMGMDRLSIEQVALGVSEMCQNAVRYADGGEVEIAVLKKNRVLRITVSDNGPGIPNLTKAMKEGFSTTPSSLGVGFAAAKRSMDHLDIQTTPGEGTTVILEKYLPMPKEEFSFGTVSLADENYLVNGDAFIVKEYKGNRIFQAVIDGLGQGQIAYQMSRMVKSLLLDHFHAPLDQLIDLCHQRLQKNASEDGGVAMSLALLTPDCLYYLGVGDTHAYVFNDNEIQHLNNVDGRVGSRQIRQLKVENVQLNGPVGLIICSDGISSQVGYADINWQKPAQNLANEVFNLFHRPYGDATVIVSKYHVS